MARPSPSSNGFKHKLKKLAEFIGPSVKISRRKFDPERHRLFVDVTHKGPVPQEALSLTTSRGRKIPDHAITCQSEPGAYITRWSAEIVMPSLTTGEQIEAAVTKPKGVKCRRRSIKSPTPQAMRRPPGITQTPRDAIHQLSKAQIAQLQSLLNGPEHSPLKPSVSYYPKFETTADFNNHYHRASWYLTGRTSPIKAVHFGLEGETITAQPGPKPDHFCAPDEDLSAFECITDDAAYQEHLAQSHVILIWKDIDPKALAALRKKHPLRVILPVATDDLNSLEYGNYSEVQWRVLNKEDRAQHQAASAAILRTRLHALRHMGHNKAVVFGTGPSIDTALSYDFSDCVSIVCNTAITSKALMDHIKPSFVCAGDVVSHFGVSKYAAKFREDLIGFLRKNDVLFFTTAKFGYLLAVKHPDLAHKIILGEQNAAGAVTDLSAIFALPMLDSTLNIHMLPLAASLFDTVYILGCDGKNPDPDENEDFWSHSTLAQYHDLVDTGHASHPTFDVHRQHATHDRYLKSVEASCLAGEIMGKRYFTLVPSFTPPLKARPIPPHMATQNAKGLIKLKGDQPQASPRRRVLMVSRASPAHFSGGRYHSLLMAESLALGGDDVVLWLDNMPRWYHNLALIEGHANITLHINSHSVAPKGDFDVVIMVPDHTPNPALYTSALNVAKASGALTFLINFESPNWFNEMSPAPKPVDNWKYWYASGAFSDAILSLADIGTEYAKEFYEQTPPHCLFEAANPVINSRAADMVRAKGLSPEKQIISISRFGKGTEHKNVHAITSLLSEATRGYTLALIVGTGAYPSPEEIAQLEAGLAPFEMTLKLLHNISDIEKFEEIAKSRCMVFQSLFEGFGYPPIEAQYMERPCVAYDLPVLREFSEGAIRFVPLGDEAAMGAALAEVLSQDIPVDGALRARVSAFATPEAMDAKMTRIIDQLQDKPRGATLFHADTFLEISQNATGAS